MKSPHSRMLVIATTVVLTLTACGETYIDDSATATTTPEIVATTVTPVPTDAGVEELMTMLADELSTLSQAVIDRDRLDQRSERIDAIWASLEPQLDATSAANTAEVVDLAHTAITSHRPADADKAYRLLLTTADAS